jgi:hypothetical protein
MCNQMSAYLFDKELHLFWADPETKAIQESMHILAAILGHH